MRGSTGAAGFATWAEISDSEIALKYFIVSGYVKWNQVTDK
jgi:hypothetical protein